MTKPAITLIDDPAGTLLCVQPAIGSGAYVTMLSDQQVENMMEDALRILLRKSRARRHEVRAVDGHGKPESARIMRMRTEDLAAPEHGVPPLTHQERVG